MGQKTCFFKKPYLYQAGVICFFQNFRLSLVHLLVLSFSDHKGQVAQWIRRKIHAIVDEGPCALTAVGTAALELTLLNTDHIISTRVKLS